MDVDAQLAGRPTLDVGHVRVTALLDGIGDIGPIQDSFPEVPLDRLLAYKDRYPGVYGTDDAWRLHIRAWLIRAAGSIILVDTGIGTERAPGPEWFGATGDLMAQIQAEGLRPEDINQVVITHMHDDHFGGTVTMSGAPAFPAARYLVPAADLEWIRQGVAEDPEAQVIWEALVTPLMEADVVQEVDGTVDLAPGVQTQSLPGHTPGHQVVRIVSEGSRLVISGDAFTHPMQLSHPDWANVSDDAPVVAAASRRKLIAELGSHPVTVLAPGHFEVPFGRMASGPDRLAGWQGI